MSEMLVNRVENDSSIEIARNTKGFTWTVKAYGSNESEVQIKLKNLISTAKQVIKELETP